MTAVEGENNHVAFFSLAGFSRFVPFLRVLMHIKRVQCAFVAMLSHCDRFFYLFKHNPFSRNFDEKCFREDQFEFSHNFLKIKKLFFHKGIFKILSRSVFYSSTHYPVWNPRAIFVARGCCHVWSKFRQSCTNWNFCSK